MRVFRDITVVIQCAVGYHDGSVKALIEGLGLWK